MTFYRERLWPSVGVLLATALVIPATLLVFLPINLWLGIACAVVLFGAGVAMLLGTAPLVLVDEEGLRAGRASLPFAHIGRVEVFRGTEAWQERGPRLDARTYLVIRGWVDPVVRVEVLDAHDPAPFWLVSTRRPEELADALERARPRTPGR